MKKCLICGHVEGDSSPTCPKCGEATWKSLESGDPLDGMKSRKAEPFPPAPSSDELPEDKEEAPPVPKKRGRR